MRVRSITPPAVIFRFQDRDGNIDTTLWPPFSNDCTPQGGLEVNTEVTLTRVANMPFPLTRSKRRILDMGCQNKIR